MTAGKIRRNWLAWALVASLCVNLAVVGLVIGAALHGKPDRPPPGGEWAMARDLPEPYRENMIAQLRAGRDKWIGPRERIGAQRSALADALDAEPFDIDRVRGILEAGRRSLDELAEHGARWEQSQGRRPSLSAMSRWLRDLGFTFKKDADRRRA